MADRVCGQTLILVDNDSTVSEVNQKIVKSTLKYMIYHMPEDRALSISTYTHELENEENYTQDVNELLCNADLMEFSAKDSNLTDVLTKVLTNWKESDFACRDIVVFTDGIEGINTEYEDTELYYLIENTSYPIYIVDLVQDNNTDAKKHLSAVATTSGGKLYLSEYPGDDAGVDKHLSDEIYGQMEIFAKREWGKYEEDEEENSNKSSGEASEEKGLESENSDELAGVNDENHMQDEVLIDDIEYEEALSDFSKELESETIIEAAKGENTISTPVMLSLVLSIGLILIIAGLISSFFVIKVRKKAAKEEKEILDKTKEAVKEVGFSKDNDFDFDPFDSDFLMSDSATGRFFEEETEGTRLLTDEDEGTRLLMADFTHDLELTDIENSDNTRLLPIEDYIVVGRKKEVCHVVIDDDSVSKKHCEFSYSDGQYYVRDLDSANGTFVNGDKVDKRRLRSGDKIRIGRSTYLVKCM